MALYVQKFGGTSVGSVERIEAVADRVQRSRAAGDDIVVVVSAMSGETDRLTSLGYELNDRPTAREMDVLLSTGEQVTIALLCIALARREVPAVSYTGWQLPIRTSSDHRKARIEEIGTERIRAAHDRGEVVVVAGFQGLSPEGEITTIGRGGSDTTAVAVAAALGADECQIYTDVDGVYTTDPRVVDDARRLDRVTFEEMLELASLGAKVLHSRSVEFAGKYGVPLRVLSSFEEGTGTLITSEEALMEQPVISGIAFSRDEAKLTVQSVPDVPGVASRILGPVGEANIDVDMIVQNVAADGSTDFTFTVHRDEMDRARETLEANREAMGARAISCDDSIVKVSVVGVGMRSHAGVASRMFAALADDNINIQMISTSEIKISVVVDERYLELAVRSLHSAFNLAEDNQAVEDSGARNR